MTASAPALAASSTPSRNGKKASEATTEPASGARALETAIRTESTRDIWPAPMPSVRPSAANTMAFDLTCLQTRQAKSRSRSSAAVGARLEATLRVGGGGRVAIARLDQEAARHAAQLDGARRRRGAISRGQQAQVLLGRQQRQRLGRERRRDHALEEGLGQLAPELAVDGAVDRDDAAEGRHRIGLARPAVGLGDARRREMAAPQGLLCLMMAAAGSANSAHEPQRRVEVEQVVVRQLLALQHLGARQRRAGRAVDGVEGRLLVRVLAVAQRARQRRRR